MKFEFADRIVTTHFKQALVPQGTALDTALRTMQPESADALGATLDDSYGGFDM